MKKIFLLLSIISFSSYVTSQTRPAITVTDWGELYSTYTLTEDDEKIIKEQSSSSELSKFKSAYTETQWPSAINTLEGRNANRNKMYDYHLYKIAELSGGEIAVVAPAGENKHMPEGMLADKDLYFIVGQAGFGGQQKAVEDIPDLSSLEDDYYGLEEQVYVAPDYSGLKTFDEQFNALLQECEQDFEGIWGQELFDDSTAIEQYQSKILPEGAQLATVTLDYSYTYSFWANYGTFDNLTKAKKAYTELVAKVTGAKPECCELNPLGETVSDTLTYTSWSVTYPPIYMEVQVSKAIDPIQGKPFYELFLGISSDY